MSANGTGPNMSVQDSSRTALSSACAGQDQTFARAFQVLEQGIALQAFPGAATAVTHCGKLVALKAAGRFTYDPASPLVTPGTVYDLASVTKVVATTAAAMVLYERGVLDLEMKLAEILPEFARASAADAPGARRADVTIRMLLAHSSGLPAYARLFEHAYGPEQMLCAACALPLEAIPGTRAAYSDVGFMLLGEVISRLAYSGLAEFCHREIFAPLGMTRTGFRPPPELRRQIPPTERTQTGELIQGVVQDENARAFRDHDAGHAGVFAPALDLARFAYSMLCGGAPILRPETVQLFTRRETSPPGSSRALGWDTPSSPSQSGQHFSPLSFGHLGYVGTSLWIDPARHLSITLLTNRTWPDRQSQAIKHVRPLFHDAVLAALEKS
jgi:CubicO group peptidase (beta-lactamase class C family)